MSIVVALFYNSSRKFRLDKADELPGKGEVDAAEKIGILLEKLSGHELFTHVFHGIAYLFLGGFCDDRFLVSHAENFAKSLRNTKGFRNNCFKSGSKKGHSLEQMIPFILACQLKLFEIVSFGFMQKGDSLASLVRGKSASEKFPAILEERTQRSEIVFQFVELIENLNPKKSCNDYREFCRHFEEFVMFENLLTLFFAKAKLTVHSENVDISGKLQRKSPPRVDSDPKHDKAVEPGDSAKAPAKSTVAAKSPDNDTESLVTVFAKSLEVANAAKRKFIDLQEESQKKPRRNPTRQARSTKVADDDDVQEVKRSGESGLIVDISDIEDFAKIPPKFRDIRMEEFKRLNGISENGDWTQDPIMQYLTIKSHTETMNWTFVLEKLSHLENQSRHLLSMMVKLNRQQVLDSVKVDKVQKLVIEHSERIFNLVQQCDGPDDDDDVDVDEKKDEEKSDDEEDKKQAALVLGVEEDNDNEEAK